MKIRRREFVFALLFPFGERDPRMAGVRFRRIAHGHSPVRYLRIHGNETTAAEALRARMTRHPGRAYLIEIPISDRTHLPKRSEPHEFFLASDPRDFELFAKGPYNAVPQQHPQPPDDGSLSRYALAHGWRYVKLEVGLGGREAQIQMLDWLVRTVPERQRSNAELAPPSRDRIRVQ